MDEKESWTGAKVKVVGGCYEKGAPGAKLRWKNKIADRSEYVKYLTAAERYWYSPLDDWYGSEKRRGPA